MTTYTTTTTAPAWATTWAILPELPTTATAAIESKRDSRAADIWQSIKATAEITARKAAKAITRIALYTFRAAWFAAIFIVTIAAMWGTMYYIGHAEILNGVTDWVRIPGGLLLTPIISIGTEILLIILTKRIDRATNHRLFNID